MMSGMRRLLIAAVLIALASTRSPASANATRLLSVQTGHSVVLDEPAVARVAVGDANVVSIRAIGAAQLLVTGRSPGRTSAVVWNGTRRSVYEIEVTEDSANRFAAMLRAAIPFTGVDVRTFDRALVVRGSVEDPREFSQLGDVLARFDKLAAARKYTVVNAVTVARPLGALQQQIASAVGPGVRVDSDAKGALIVSGRVADRTRAEWVLSRVRGLAGPYLAADAKVIDRLEVDTVSQIDVKVRVYEVDKTALDQLGVRLQSGTPDPTNPANIILGGPFFPIVESAAAAVAGRALNVGAFARTVRLVPTLDLLSQRGDAKLLSEPNLVTLPGNPATFLVGGEIPIPYSTGVGQVSIVYKEFGVRLNITPLLLGSGAVEAKIMTEVSELDFQDAVTSNGFTMPALRTSRLTTDVVTQSGESIVLGGMMRRVEQKTIDRIPLLGSLPIIGALFRSTRYQTSQTDIVFVMTPSVIVK
jgi:Flp pilus assembly secretin CpaC